MSRVLCPAWRLARLGVGLAAGVLAGCGPAAPPNVLLVTVDTLRSDALSSYGNARPTTPFLDRLASEGIRFERAYSTSSWTTPAVASLLTSTYPSRHGMGGRPARTADHWDTLPAELPSLPEVLADAGYRTYALVANFGLPPERGFDRGFDRYECLGAKDLEEVGAALETWLPELPAAAPWFFWLHLFDPHAPYVGREPWASQFWPEPPPPPFRARSIDANELLRQHRGLSPEAIAYARALYDSETRALDEFLRDLFPRLPGAERVFFVLTADHGEEFLDHGGVLHGRNLFEESIRVPLILRPPSGIRPGRVVAEPASLVDVLPTILAAAGAEPPAEAAGRDLLAPSPRRPRTAVAELLRGEGVRSVTDGRWKLILARGSPDHVQLFDLASDPAERRDLVELEPEIVERLRSELEPFEGLEPATTGKTPIAAGERQALEALGYLQ